MGALYMGASHQLEPVQRLKDYAFKYALLGVRLPCTISPTSGDNTFPNLL
jgi:hypothetical protein